MEMLMRNEKRIDIVTSNEDMSNIRPNRGDGDHVLSGIAIRLTKDRIKQ
jgi:hypothetical protein